MERYKTMIETKQAAVDKRMAEDASSNEQSPKKAKPSSDEWFDYMARIDPSLFGQTIIEELLNKKRESDDAVGSSDTRASIEPPIVIEDDTLGEGTDSSRMGLPLAETQLEPPLPDTQPEMEE